MARFYGIRARLAIGATIWAWRLGRGHRVAGSSPLSSDCTAVHVLLCIPSRAMIDTGRILIEDSNQSQSIPYRTTDYMYSTVNPYITGYAANHKH